MSEGNGNGKSRLDRIEEMIERQVRANEAAHEFFIEEDKRLLTAQILMNGAMHKMADGMTSLAVKMTEMAEGVTTLELKMGAMAAGMTSLELKMEETTGKLNALIDTVDGIIRKVQ